MPGAIALLLAGALIQAGDLSILMVVLFALFGSVTGDQLGYPIGLRAGHILEGRISKNPLRAKKIGKAKAAMRKQGGLSIYFSRWLLTPLGPTINLVARASDMSWRKFTFWSISGEFTWVCVLVPIGYFFSSNIEKTAYIVGDAIWIITGTTVALFVGNLFWKKTRKRDQS